MKHTPLICMCLLMICGPMQRPGEADMPPRLQHYWFKKTRKEILRAKQPTILQALNNSLHFVSSDGLKQLLPVLTN